MKRLLAALILLCGTPAVGQAETSEVLFKDTRNLITAINSSLEELKNVPAERSLLCTELLPEVDRLDKRLEALAQTETGSLTAKAAEYDVEKLQEFIAQRCA